MGKGEFFVSSRETGKIKLIAKEVSSNIDIVNIPSVEFVE